MCEPLPSYADRMAVHALCLERAAQDPAAVADPRIAARLRLVADVARTAARLAGAPTDQETRRV